MLLGDVFKLKQARFFEVEIFLQQEKMISMIEVVNVVCGLVCGCSVNSDVSMFPKTLTNADSLSTCVVIICLLYLLLLLLFS